jgi:hypothetical protein
MDCSYHGLTPAPGPAKEFSSDGTSSLLLAENSLISLCHLALPSDYDYVDYTLPYFDHYITQVQGPDSPYYLGY